MCAVQARRCEDTHTIIKREAYPVHHDDVCCDVWKKEKARKAVRCTFMKKNHPDVLSTGLESAFRPLSKIQGSGKKLSAVFW